MGLSSIMHEFMFRNPKIAYFQVMLKVPIYDIVQN